MVASVNDEEADDGSPSRDQVLDQIKKRISFGLDNPQKKHLLLTLAKNKARVMTFIRSQSGDNLANAFASSLPAEKAIKSPNFKSAHVAECLFDIQLTIGALSFRQSSRARENENESDWQKTVLAFNQIARIVREARALAAQDLQKKSIRVLVENACVRFANAIAQMHTR